MNLYQVSLWQTLVTNVLLMISGYYLTRPYCTLMDILNIDDIPVRLTHINLVFITIGSMIVVTDLLCVFLLKRNKTMLFQVSNLLLSGQFIVVIFWISSIFTMYLHFDFWGNP